MAASRAARKREMIANLENEEYLNDLANESYAIIFTQSTTNTVAQKKVKKAFEAGGCHIGTKDKHASWKAGNGDFQTVDAFLWRAFPGQSVFGLNGSRGSEHKGQNHTLLRQGYPSPLWRQQHHGQGP